MSTNSESGPHAVVDEAREPSYGTGIHYVGSKGEEYFGWQDSLAEAGAHLNARKFSPYISPADTVLDFGCGGGVLLAKLECAQKIGVEINPAARAAAQRRGIDCVADLGEIEAGIIDVAISNHALEHIPNPVAALSALWETVRPGGRLVLCVPINDWRAEKHFDPSDRNHHLHTWTPLLIGNTLIEAGWVVEPDNIRIFEHAWPPAYGRLSRILPAPVFDACCHAWAVLRRRRQLIAIADRR